MSKYISSYETSVKVPMGVVAYGSTGEMLDSYIDYRDGYDIMREKKAEEVYKEQAKVVIAEAEKYRGLRDVANPAFIAKLSTLRPESWDSFIAENMKVPF